MTASVHNLRRKRMLAKTLLAIFEHDTKRGVIFVIFSEASQLAKPRCGVRYTLPGCRAILTEITVGND